MCWRMRPPRISVIWVKGFDTIKQFCIKICISFTANITGESDTILPCYQCNITRHVHGFIYHTFGLHELYTQCLHAWVVWVVYTFSSWPRSLEMASSYARHGFVFRMTRYELINWDLDWASGYAQRRDYRWQSQLDNFTHKVFSFFANW